VKGIWEGVMTSSVKTDITEKKIDGCPLNASFKNNLTVDTPEV